MAASPHLLQAPPLTNFVLSRPQLVIAPGTGTTMIWSCAGSGKTTLLAQWADELKAAGEAAAWISLPAAGTPRHRLAALTCASIAAAQVPGCPPGAGGARLNLLLDDVHHLSDPGEIRWLDQLIKARPREVRIVLTGRHPPDLHGSTGLARSSDPAVVYGTADLAFTTAETAAFFALRGLRLAPSEVDAIHRRTGGWAAALTLLAGFLPRAASPLPLDFEPGHRAAADYLVAEILDLLPAAYFGFLLTLCVADAVTVPLAVRLTQRADASLLLDHLEHRTGLLNRSVSGGMPVYIFHPVLLRYLRTEFRRRDLAGYARALTTAPASNAPPAGTGPLTPKEQEILQELPRHQTIREIAARQRLSPNTVKTHLRVVYQKLGVRNRTAAVKRAVEQGLL